MTNPNVIDAIRKGLSIPQYYKERINPTVDLISEPKQCCPFHKEDTPSFSFSAEKGLWRCFGACKAGGDVIAMHQKNLKLPTREEAIESLAAILGIHEKDYYSFDIKPDKGLSDTHKELVRLLATLELRAKNSEQWVELDEAMSYYETAPEKLERLRCISYA
jgi:DNA primase